mgnify:CR=1 FL=1
MTDHLQEATSSVKVAISKLKKKHSNLKISVERFGAELDAIDLKLDSIATNADIYRVRVQRATSREVKRLQLEIERLQKELDKNTNRLPSRAQASEEEMNIAKSICIFECLMRHLSKGADDFRLISEAFLFPAVYERIVDARDDAYFLDYVPHNFSHIIARGKEFITALREVCTTYLTYPDAWSAYVVEVADWWRNEALPLLYGSRADDWDIDEPYSLAEMTIWKESPGDRPTSFPKIFDGFEIYGKNQDAAFEETGVRIFEVKTFTYSQSNEEIES